MIALNTPIAVAISVCWEVLSLVDVVGNSSKLGLVVLLLIEVLAVVRGSACRA